MRLPLLLRIAVVPSSQTPFVRNLTEFIATNPGTLNSSTPNSLKQIRRCRKLEALSSIVRDLGCCQAACKFAEHDVVKVRLPNLSRKKCPSRRDAGPDIQVALGCRRTNRCPIRESNAAPVTFMRVFSFGSQKRPDHCALSRSAILFAATPAGARWSLCE